MRRVFLFLAIAPIAFALALTWSNRPRAECPPASACPVPSGAHASAPSPCPAQPPLSHSFKNPEREGLLFRGVGSCAAMACHHGNGPKGSKGSEYSTWIAVDPHAKAIQTLYSRESEQMHNILVAAFPEMKCYKTADQNPLCLNCHAMGHKAPERFQGDGVGCERCHGPAEKWNNTHYLNGFDRRTPGFVDTRCDLAARAYTCMKCHVGNASQEVNHVLIAAGHPRLRFEYGAYYANYPRHWEDLGEKRGDPTFEAYNWALGELITARAALELLVSRAADPAKKDNWPEFAEFDCTACHHDLKNPSRRQERLFKNPKIRRAGDLPWGTWYYPLLPVLARNVSGAPMELLENQKKLDKLMRLRLPPREQVAALADRSISLLDAWIERVLKDRATGGKPSFPPALMHKIVKDLASQSIIVEDGWDGGAKVYLGLAAMHQATGDADPSFLTRSKLRKPLVQVRDDLKNSFPPPRTKTLYESPRDYFKKLDSIFKGLETVRRKAE